MINPGMKEIFVVLLLAGVGQDARIAVPSDAAQGQAEKLIREIFKEEYLVKTPAAQRKLAKKLLQQGLETNDDPISRYVLFREAGDLAARSGDVETVIRSADALIAGYQLDRLAFKESLLSRAEPATTNPEDLKRLVEVLLELARESTELDQFDAAVKSTQSALAAARKSKDIGLVVRVDARLKSVTELRTGYDKARKAEETLVATPEDPQANLAWGEYLCLSKGQWEKGLPFLSRGPDSALKKLATRELGQPAEPGPQIELADGWWDLGEKEKNALWKSRLLAHAQTFYEMALPGTTGLTRLRVEKRIAAGNALGPPSRVNRAGLVAWWKCDEGKGTTVANSAGPGNVMTLMNGVEWLPGRLGRALKLDGTTGYLTCKSENLPATNAAQTISFWLFLTSPPTRGQDLLCFSNDALSGAIQAGVSPGRLAFWKFGGVSLGKAPLPTVNAWHHWAYVFDGKTHSVYLDGKLESSVTVAPQSVPVTICEFGRYRGVGATSGYFSGSLDDVRIYNRALPEAEVRGLATGNE